MTSKTPIRVLIVDDDDLIATMLARGLGASGYTTRIASDPAIVLDEVRSFQPHVALLDVNLPGKSGIDLLQELQGLAAAPQVVMLTADDSAETAVRAMKLGATDYLTKPFNLDEVKIVVGNAVEKQQLREEVDYLRRISTEITERPVIGDSAAMTAIREQAIRLAEAGVNTVLITGESGTGKEVLARFVHGLTASARGGRYAPFVGINCAAMPEHLVESELFGHERGAFTDARAEKKGLFELAQGGSILLDEIGDMPLFLQSKLLRVLEERQVRRVGGRQDLPIDATVFATTNRNLQKAVEAATFRQDLFYRLSAFPLHIPPLRERPEDIPVLVRHFLARFAERYGRPGPVRVDARAAELLTSYDWPGNIRELRNVVERIVVLGRGDTVLPEHLPPEILGSRPVAPSGPVSASDLTIPDEGISLEDIERDLIAKALEKAGGNKTVAAKLLNMTYDSLRYQVKKFGLE